MRWLAVFAVILFGIPLLTLGWLTAVDGKVLFVKNPNTIPVSIQFETQDGTYTETTDPRTVDAGALTWLVFNPQIKGESGMMCTGMRGATRIPLSTPEHPLPMFSKVTLDSCEGTYVLRVIQPHHAAKVHHITPPSPL